MRRSFFIVFLGMLACRETHPPTSTAHDGHGGHTHAHDPRFQDPEQFAARWNDPARDAWQKPDEIVAAMGISPGARVADLGAGTGYMLPHLSSAVGEAGEVLAVDVEPAMVRYLEQAITAAGWNNVRAVQAQPDDPNVAAGSLDGVVTVNVWHHISDRPRYAATLLEAVRPGGVVLIVDFLAEETEGPGPPMEMRLTSAQVQADLKAGGFTVEIPDESLPRHYIVRGVRPGGQR